MTPVNAFKTHVGQFWGILSTRDYVRARFTLAEAHLIVAGTLDGILDGLHM
jgi:hypothetical protein